MIYIIFFLVNILVNVNRASDAGNLAKLRLNGVISRKRSYLHVFLLVRIGMGRSV